MKRLTDRRTILLAAGTTAAAAMAGTVAAQSADILGTVVYEGGAPIPPGRIRISLDGGSSSDAARSAAPASLDSNGKATSVEFAVPQPAAGARAATPVEVVATLEREADGWLLARGSAPFTPGAPITITLYTAMY
ncbi:hypothetical protein [Paracoccus sp. S1E-3]|uniref:hypothetical protein n=1 Tax=Paracoccus sp. S1E-3 TaxID=2756130 RepID=UPI0015EEF103|nr:hypothetical protein [Paracoccus sp. S1E-3]MBA4491331.1 hypothetical protein [Paracoccus sp. S1E-3]